jgi:CelD/BcsL family acetyltransferase involved in cellulose biosynthesis
MLARMRALDLDELDQAAPDYDGWVAACADVDRFCTSSHWVIPAARGLMPSRKPWIRRGEQGFLAFMRVAREDGSEWLEPLEAMWGLACPVVGEPAALARELAAALTDEARVVAVMLCGMGQRTHRFLEVARALEPTCRLALGPPTRRYVADLRGGPDDFLARRSPAFRRSLRKAARRAAREGVEIVPMTVDAANAGEAFERLLAVDTASWKGRLGVGIADGMVGFYRHMLPRLAACGAARLMFARRDGRDLAYIFGGVLGNTYRGLQFGFVAGQEELSLGNVCQLHQIEALCREGVAFYDLGSEVEYKRRWGELSHETVMLIAMPR